MGLISPFQTYYEDEVEWNEKVGMDLNSKPTYYLLRSDFNSDEDFNAERDKYIKMGFRVVSLREGANNDINAGIKALVKNHWTDSG
ncbi:MAG: hypothetical protein LUC32_06105 [Clostridiales bacterium]|nr:hypothetical protein [Clostridiales bacterium]